jgi:YfiH family protein
VHGIRVLEVAGTGDAGAAEQARTAADAQVTTAPGIALGVLVADCLPVLLADRAGSVVGAAHAGWRGLAAGVLENTITLMRQRRPGADLIAWLGPCIGPAAFEVGEDVVQVFVTQDPQSAGSFVPAKAAGKWWADLPGLAARRLRRAGISSVDRADACTVNDPESFWSYRREPVCGRMAGSSGCAPERTKAHPPVATRPGQKRLFRSVGRRDCLGFCRPGQRLPLAPVATTPGVPRR